MSKRKTFNVLSIDGGGIRGIIPARILAEIERRTAEIENRGRETIPIAELFDLIAGTSTGGLLALGLSVEGDNEEPAHTAEELVQIYRSRGDEIFDLPTLEDALSAMRENLRPSLGRWILKIEEKVSLGRNLLNEKYSHEGLTEVLNCYFGDAMLSESHTHTMVTCYDIHNRHPVFLKSWKQDHADIRMVDAARATSAAPTFFEPHQFCIGSDRRALIDGGVYINSPVVSAYAEAVKLITECEDFEDYCVSDIFVLSLGTGELTRRINYEEAKDWGIAEWALPLLSCIFNGVSKAADYQMNQILGPCRYIRLQRSLDSGCGNDDMDDVTDENINRLEDRANDLIDDEQFPRVLECLGYDAGGTSE